MNNEPVAWMSLEGWAYGKHETRPLECNIPLYTHPVKELTKEEISGIRDKYLTPKDCDIYTFARAILGKAQEK